MQHCGHLFAQHGQPLLEQHGGNSPGSLGSLGSLKS